MRILICVAVALCCVAAQAGDCPNGRCSLNQPVRTVTKETVQTARNITVGTVRAVTPPYRGRCTNGRCKVR